MLIPTSPTPESMHLTLSMLRNVRGTHTADELTLRRLRHCLGKHLQLPGMIDPGPPRSAAPEPVTNERILELVLDALADVSGESEEDARSLTKARQVIATQLAKEPAILFKDGSIILEASPWLC